MPCQSIDLFCGKILVLHTSSDSNLKWFSAESFPIFFMQFRPVHWDRYREEGSEAIMAVARWWNPWKPLVPLPTHHALAPHSGGAHCDCERRECSTSGGPSSQAEPWNVGV